MADANLYFTLNGADEMASMTRKLIDRCRSAGSVADVERRIGREINDELVHDLFTIEQIGTDLWVEPTPEFHRVMSALDG